MHPKRAGRELPDNHKRTIQIDKFGRFLSKNHPFNNGLPMMPNEPAITVFIFCF
jgi:hypothetical protein